MKKKYVLDTSVYLTNADAVYAFGNNDIIVPLIVLEEIDRQKKRQDLAGANARKIIRTFDSLREKGNLNKGVRLGKGRGKLIVKNFDKKVLPSSYDHKIADNKIIATALTEAALPENTNRKVILVSRDINMRVKCDALDQKAEPYSDEQVVQDLTHVYDGFGSHLVDDEIIDRFYEHKKLTLTEEDGKFYPNQFLMLVSNSNEKKTALAKFIAYEKPLIKINGTVNKREAWGISARNKEQTFALDLLSDPEIKIVTLVGKAGSGKTLCAIAAGMEQVIESKLYKRLIVSRPIQPLGKDIGYLPGTLEEKMTPWLGPIDDNLKYLMKNDRAMLAQYVDNGSIEIEALTYIRGRSISNAFIIIDEAQNLTNHELKTIITRVGDGTKVVLTGDIEQIDNIYVDETTNGLTHAVEKFKEYDIAGHITLKKGERSAVATLAAKIL